MNEKAEDLAFGRWPDILQARGMSASYFSGKNGPCPFCPDGGGKDRYRWAQKKYGGVWVCSACTEGKYATGINMLMKHMGYQSFLEAVDDVRDYFRANENVKPIAREQRLAMGGSMTPELVLRNRTRMQRTWNEGCKVTSGDPVDLYLQSRVRGLDFAPDNIRLHPALPYWAPPPDGQDKPVLLGLFPAMLAYAQAPDGALAQLHRTYLTPQGAKADVPLVKKNDLGVGINSFAVRMLEPYGDTLGVCEGIETGCASAMLRDIPVWPCLNGPAMSEFELPPELRGVVRKLVIFEDSDELKAFGRNPDGSTKWRRPGSVYAQKLADRARQWGLRTLIIKSSKVGDDIADYWSAQATA